MRMSPRPETTPCDAARALVAVTRVVGSIAQQHGLCERVVPVVREREDDTRPAPGQRNGTALAGEDDGRRLAALAANLDLAPLDPHPESGTQRLERGLLGSKTRREMLDGIAATLAIGDLVIGEHAPEEPLVPALHDFAHPRDQRQINPDALDAHARLPPRSRRPGTDFTARSPSESSSPARRRSSRCAPGPRLRS